MEKKILIQKKERVEELTKKMQTAKTIVVFDYLGLTVEQFTALRKELRNAGCDVQVFKNNISRRASNMAGFKGFDEFFKGPKAIAFSNDDVVAPAKIVYDFSKKAKSIVIQAGVVEGKVEQQEEIIGLAKIPSREGLLTMLAMGMLQPLSNLSIALNLLAEKLEAN